MIMEDNNIGNYLYGMHPVLEALRSGKNVVKVLLKQGLEGPQFRELMEILNERKIQFQFVPVEKLAKISRGGAHQGVAACISDLEPVSLEEMVNNALAVKDNPVFVILDGVSDVRNFGAIARTLECAGGSGIILPAKGGAGFNAAAVKTSAGSLMRLDVCRVPNLKYAIYFLKQNGFRLVSATEKTDRLIYDVDLTGPVAIVLGSESKGISKPVLDLSDDRAAIPMAGEISSLNVSAAASVVLFEAVRQRKVSDR